MDKIAQAKLDEELAHVIAEATQSRVSITEAIVMIRKMEKAGWVFTNAKLEADMKKAGDEKAEAEREKLAAEKPPAPQAAPVKRVDPIAPDPHPVTHDPAFQSLGSVGFDHPAVHEPFPAPEKPAEVTRKP